MEINKNIENITKKLLEEIGEDPTREGLTKTPERVADAYKEIFAGYDSNSELSVQFSEDSEVVVVRDIQFYSMCEHHILPFFGKIQLAYTPNGRVFGISKHRLISFVNPAGIFGTEGQSSGVNPYPSNCQK